ncbi:MAG: hypothetical protein KGY70_20640, partial [Bacteroidales bacterium]|nr:hypothetical protein [Bacteroidales bacterium]
MKTYTKLYLIIILLFAGIGHTSAQRIGDLHGINYQAVAIDEEGKEIVGMDMEGKPLYEKEIGVRFTINKGQNGDVLYQETHTALTNQHGLFSLVIGKGEQTGGTYTHLNDIPWIEADQWLKVEISIENNGNYRMVSNQRFMSVPYSFYTDNIADNAITTEKILDHEIQNEDIDTGSVDTRVIEDGSIVNEDIADQAINLQQKVTDTLPVVNGGTGRGAVPEGSILVGKGVNSLDTLMVSDSAMVLTNFEGQGNTKLYKLRAGARTSLSVDSTNRTITITAAEQQTGPGTGVGRVNTGIINAGDQSVREFPIDGVEMNDIILPSVGVDLQGLTMSAYVASAGHVKVVFFNGSNSSVDLGTIDVA